MQKRVVAIHDISCVGKCSLTVALPIISAAGVECSIIPTAVLSTHTGGFDSYTYRDLTDDIMPIVQHWETLNFPVDCIYSGFLGSREQIAILCGIVDTYHEKGSLIVVDPVMADNGKMYTIFDSAFAAEMATLCKRADVIVPNMTEAAFLLGEAYQAGPYTHEYINGLLARLAGLGPKKVVLTGVYYDDSTLGVAVYDREKGTNAFCSGPRIDRSYHGTGDVYASALVSALMNGFSLEKSAQVAVNYTIECIVETKEAATEARYGVIFEKPLAKFAAQF